MYDIALYALSAWERDILSRSQEYYALANAMSLWIEAADAD